jgi:hypothetical protein
MTNALKSPWGYCKLHGPSTESLCKHGFGLRMLNPTTVIWTNLTRNSISKSFHGFLQRVSETKRSKIYRIT